MQRSRRRRGVTSRKSGPCCSNPSATNRWRRLPRSVVNCDALSIRDGSKVTTGSLRRGKGCLLVAVAVPCTSTTSLRPPSFLVTDQTRQRCLGSFAPTNRVCVVATVRREPSRSSSSRVELVSPDGRAALPTLVGFPHVPRRILGRNRQPSRDEKDRRRLFRLRSAGSPTNLSLGVRRCEAVGSRARPHRRALGRPPAARARAEA